MGMQLKGLCVLTNLIADLLKLPNVREWRVRMKDKLKIKMFFYIIPRQDMCVK